VTHQPGRAWVVIALAAASCGSPRGTPAIVNPSPHVARADVLVVADPGQAGGSRLRFVAIADDGLVVTRTLTIPGEVETIAWVGAEPIVLLGGDGHDGEVGAITRTGYVPFPTVPAATWRSTRPGESSDPLDPPMWRLTVDATGAVWQGHCDWGHRAGSIAWHGAGDGNWCDAWVDARISPAPLMIARVEPRPLAYELAAIAPSTTTKLELVPLGPDGGNEILRCTEAGTTIEYPPDNQREDFRGIRELTWLSTSPPMVQFVESMGDGNRPSHDETVIFEGCAASPDYQQASVAAGPHELTAIFTYDKLSLRRSGKALGTLDHVAKLCFAPAPLPGS
jgi:hypothetical protein